jgi:hypothetical protein
MVSFVGGVKTREGLKKSEIHINFKHTILMKI